MELYVGMRASIKKTITEADIYNIIGISAEANQGDGDEEKTRTGFLEESMACRMIATSLISVVLGTKLPGQGTIFLNQSLDFKNMVNNGNTIEAIVTLNEIMDQNKGIYKFDTSCINQNGDIIIEGTAVVKNQKTILVNESTKKYDSFYSKDELETLGLKCYGKNVLISRKAVLYNPQQLEIGNNVRIDDFTTISGKVVLGNYIHIAQMCGLYGGDEGIYMDDFTAISSKCVIYATSNDYSGNSMTNPMVPAKYKTTDKNLPVHLKKHVIIGCTSVVLPGVTIGLGSAVGAMSMVSKSLEEWGIYAGSPAKRIKERSKKILELEEQMMRECESDL